MPIRWPFRLGTVLAIDGKCMTKQNGTRVFKVVVSSIGYEDLVVEIRANTKQLAMGTNNRLMAIIEWEKHNDIEDSAELPFVRFIS